MSLGHGGLEISQGCHFKQGDVSLLLVLVSRLVGTRRHPQIYSIGNIRLYPNLGVLPLHAHAMAKGYKASHGCPKMPLNRLCLIYCLFCFAVCLCGPPLLPIL